MKLFNDHPFLLLPSSHKKCVFPAEPAPLLIALYVDFISSKNNVKFILTHYSKCTVDLCRLFHTFGSAAALTIFSERVAKRSLLTYQTRAQEY